MQAAYLRYNSIITVSIRALAFKVGESVKQSDSKPTLKCYAAPVLIRYGSIRQITSAVNMNGMFDGQTPKGQNKSSL